MPTMWEVKTNILCEMSCFLNVLCISKPYQEYYIEDYKYWRKIIDTYKMRDHLDLIREVIYHDRNQIISSELCLYFSMLSDDPTIENVLNITEEELQVMRKKAEKNYWNEKNWNAFVKVLPSVQIILDRLYKSGFEEYWGERYRKDIQEKCNEIENNIKHIDIVSEIEQICRKNITNNKVELFIVHFTLPHCIKLYGNKMIGISVVSPVTMAWISLHEMIHTPYKYGNDIKQIIEDMKKNPSIKNAVESHEKWLGYNTYETFFDEQCTKALDHFIGEKLNIIPNDAVSKSVEDRQREEDGGIHILFPVIYRLLRDEYNYSQSFQEFIVDMYRKGKLL